MLGNSERTRKTYLSIKEGKVNYHYKGVPEKNFDFIEGNVVDIYSKERDFNGSLAKFWYIDIQDGKTIYSLSFPFNSGVFRSVLLSLASVPLSPYNSVRIQPYLGSNGYTKVQTFKDGVKLSWVTKEVPPLRDVLLPDGTITKDESERVTFLRGYVDRIKKELVNSNN